MYSQYQMMMSGKDFLNSHVVLSWRRKVYSDWEDVRPTWPIMPIDALSKYNAYTIIRLLSSSWQNATSDTIQ